MTCFRRWGDLRADPNPNPRGCAQALCAACVTHNMQKALWYPTGTVSKEMEFMYKIVGKASGKRLAKNNIKFIKSTIQTQDEGQKPDKLGL